MLVYHLSPPTPRPSQHYELAEQLGVLGIGLAFPREKNRDTDKAGKTKEGERVDIRLCTLDVDQFNDTSQM